MTLSDRARKVLAGVLLLPEGQDGWRRGEYRDQLHMSVGLSRGGVARSFASGELAGLVLVQGVGRSARLPEGYRLTPEGARLARDVGPIQPIQPDPVDRSSPDPVLSLAAGLYSERTNEKPYRPTERTDPAPIQIPDPATTTRLSFDEQTLSVLYAAMTQTPLCACVRPMHAKTQAKTGTWFWACMLGRKGCGLTLPMRWQPKAGAKSIEQGKARRDQSHLTPRDILSVMGRTAEARRA